uniref:Putative ovule protein n=1 Tax=Solanum chacoense TaxID=4108 RepID=A0A0V0HJ80_SOLCH
MQRIRDISTNIRCASSSQDFQIIDVLHTQSFILLIINIFAFYKANLLRPNRTRKLRGRSSIKVALIKSRVSYLQGLTIRIT